MIDRTVCKLLGVELVTAPAVGSAGPHAWIRLTFEKLEDKHIYYQHIRFIPEPWIGVVCHSMPAKSPQLSVINMKVLAEGH